MRFFREGNSAITRPFFIVSVAKLDGDAVALGVAAVIKRQGIRGDLWLRSTLFGGGVWDGNTQAGGRRVIGGGGDCQKGGCSDARQDIHQRVATGLIDRFLPLSADRDARAQFLRFFREGNSAITRPFFIVSVTKLDGDAVALGVAAVIKRQGIRGDLWLRSTLFGGGVWDGNTQAGGRRVIGGGGDCQKGGCSDARQDIYQ